MGSDSAQKAAAANGGGGQPPSILNLWIGTYRNCPKLYIPGTHLNLAYILASTAVLLLARQLSDWIFVHVFQWPATAKMTAESAACAVSGLQAALFVPSLGACLVTTKPSYRPSGKMADSPVWWQDAAKALIHFCTGYMLYDSIMLCVDTWDATAGRPMLSSADLMFIGHHFATTFYMTTALLQGAGHQSAMILMFLGEMTSPLMNTHAVLKFAVKIHPESTLIYNALVYSEYIYAVVYLPMRVVLGPLAAAHLTYDLLLTKEGRQNCSVFITLLWMPMCWGVLFGSIPWITEALEMVQDGLTLKYGPDYDYGEEYIHHHTDL